MNTKKILGLDLGTNSIGWAVVNEDQDGFNSSIVKIGVRTIHYDNFVNSESGKDCMNPEKDFLGGKSISCNAKRTQIRSAHRNLQRFKKRREVLVHYLKEYGIINDDTVLTETGNKTTFETIKLRALAATEEISLEQFARVLLMINKKRGYKSSRKTKSSDEGELIDGMEIAKKMFEENLTPGAINYSMLKDGKNTLPSYYRSDLLNEFDKVWKTQAVYNSDYVTDELYKKVRGVNKKATWAILVEPWHLVGEKRTTKEAELKLENAKWRKDAVSQPLTLEQLIIVLQDINNDINSSSGYLGAIGDRSKELFFNKQTVGQYQYAKLLENPHYSFKNQVFYRQDYFDEFEKLWEVQSKFHPELTEELKYHLQNEAIFFQRPLKSKKGELAICELEGRQITKEIDGKIKTITIGPKVCPASSPLFQEYRIWGVINNIKVKDGKLQRELTPEEKEKLFNILNWNEKLAKEDIKKELGVEVVNYKQIKGNTTNAALSKIIPDLSKREDYKTDVCRADEMDNSGRGQKLMQLWHLLYSYEGDNSISGIDSLLKILKGERFGFDEVTAKSLANISLEDDYSQLSSRAIRKILPFMRQGMVYSDACAQVGYNHSKRSLTKEELERKEYIDHLSLIEKNSLRNPVVEKILNQMVNVVNQVIETYGKPDEIRIELARELKKSSQERKEMSDGIAKAEAINSEVRKKLETDFGIKYVSQNDIIRYKLYEELKNNGYKTLYSNTYIPQEKLFSKDKEFDIEHIIPQASVFDNSFKNKTLEKCDVNLRKGKQTAFDFVKDFYGEEGLSEYKSRVEKLKNDGSISTAKYNNLLMSAADIPSGFIDRDLRDSQYIARKAREILEQIVPHVVTTTGSVTARLREDWQLVDIMKELNWGKYNSLGLTELQPNRDGNVVRRIVDWSKRNDNRHHAMDALTIAFTRRAYIQYLNNLNARIEKGVEDWIDLDMVELSDISKEKRSSVIYAIEKKFLERRNGQGGLHFKSPMPLESFRQEAKRQLEATLVSVKAKNKVTTKNTYKIAGKENKYQSLTPRGSLHNDTIYGSIKQEVLKEEKIGANFSEEKIQQVCNPLYRTLLLNRLHENNNDPKKAFTGKNALNKKPIFIDDSCEKQMPEKVKTKTYETQYTIRKPISKDLKIDKVINPQIREILKKRLEEYGNNAEKAFSNLDENPIWLNKEAGIQIKRVTISGVSNVVALHTKHDHLGKEILGENNKPTETDFVSTSNNHHVAIFEDADGNLQEHIVSFYEATISSNLGLPIIDKEYKKDEGWRFLFTMKQNEMFVFPNEKTGFNPNEIDLLDPNNYALISPNLFRIQKLARKDYWFRHHLETTVDEKKELRDITYKHLQNTNALRGVIKVRINHIGAIVSVGEY